MERELYLTLLRDLLSQEPVRIRAANRELYGALVGGDDSMKREADLVLAETAQAC
jgi:hypothetical protein